MKLPQEFDDDPKMNTTIIKMIIGVTLSLAAVLILVLVINREPRKKNPVQPSGVQQEQVPDAGQDTAEIVPGKLTPDDLDFWDLYPTATPEPDLPESTEKPADPVDDPSTDGRHTLVVNDSGEEEWVLISPYLPKHDYDFTKLVCQSDIMKYYVDGKQVSYVGVDVSKYQDYIDFVKVKKAGIDFVMIRVGVRGYGTGQVMLDENFQDNIKRASDAGLKIGLYFLSQAITEEEAVDEADLVLENIWEYVVAYPIAFDMEPVKNDVARTDNLSRQERTAIAKAFMDRISDAGYKAMLYGNKEWLIKKLDLSRLTAYDVWLSQPGDLPDYPYKFTMWQYSTTTVVDGIVGYSNMNISFIDYSEK